MGTLPTPIAIKECQFWGGYDDERCLYEKTIFAVEGKQCVEECQHWKETGKRCLYSTKCEFYRDQQIFVETRCIDFNEFISKCEKTVKEVID